jgi:hypothetical protein
VLRQLGIGGVEHVEVFLRAFLEEEPRYGRMKILSEGNLTCGRAGDCQLLLH